MNRPQLPLNPDLPVNPAEQFQNEVLRPILKAKNDLLVEVVTHFVSNQVKQFATLKLEQKELQIRNTCQKNNQNNAFIRGLVISDLSCEEFERYTDLEKESNRRIIQMVIQRVTPQVIERINN